jgi:voltage-gated potassium channel
MKFYSSLFTYFISSKSSRQNLGTLFRFIALTSAMITLYSVLFHFIMAAEGQEFSWITGFYWTFVTMSTLGFGDIIFTSDPGKLFSIIVLLSGIVFLLILLPFAVIKFFFAPWFEERSRRKYNSELPAKIRGHVIITCYEPVTIALIEKLQAYGINYIVLVDDYSQSKELYDKGVNIAVGHLDDPETYTKMRVSSAALVIATNRDELNTNIAFTVKELSAATPIIATADSPHSVDILEMAGCSRVIEISDILGASLAGWVLGGFFQANTIARLDEIMVVQTPAISTPLVGKTLATSRLREDIGVTVIGVWERGRFELAGPDTPINRETVLIMAGNREQIETYNEVYAFYQITKFAGDPVIIFGAGRVGETVAGKLEEQSIPFLIVDRNPRRIKDDPRYLLGDAADIHVLEKAGLDKAPAAIITTHDDATNIYLAKYLRSLRPDLQIISRANMDRNVSTMHRAGADFVMSYSSLGANAIFNFLMNKDTFMLAEGLNIFRLPTPKSLIGKSLSQSNIRQTTGCTVIGISAGAGTISINPDPHQPISADTELVMTGTYDAELNFVQSFK